MIDYLPEEDFELSDGLDEVKLSRDVVGNAVTNVPHKHKIHSPTGFEWGYGGSGPCDLALNILALYVPFSYACAWKHDFKWDVIAKIPKEGTVIKRETIIDWIERKKYDERGL